MKWDPTRVGIGATVVALLFALTYPAWAPTWCSPGHCFTVNEYGDWLAGFAQPIALAWLIAGFWLQRIELQLQRKELEHTRGELARQAQAQEQTAKAGLAQQVLTQLPIASDAIFRKLWPLIPISAQVEDAYHTKDLDYVVRRVQLLSPSETFYGDTESKERDMIKRGALQALSFAEKQIAGVVALADLADASGGLRGLVESTLLRNELRVLRITADKELGQDSP